MRTGDDEAASPKYAHIERERRFLVDPHRRPALDLACAVRIEDRYIDSSRLRLRRMTDLETGATSLKLTKKYTAADPAARAIVTAYLDAAEYALLATLPARALAKIRYTVDDHGAAFGVDCFEGALHGLELAEIECADATNLAAIRAPAWSRREVTHDSRYTGGNLVNLAALDLATLLQGED
jgi:CYTH domain-containing protein